MRACASGSSADAVHEHADAPHSAACARAASGHAPPRRRVAAMNSRRLMSRPQLRRQHRTPQASALIGAEIGFATAT